LRSKTEYVHQFAYAPPYEFVHVAVPIARAVKILFAWFVIKLVATHGAGNKVLHK